MHPFALKLRKLLNLAVFFQFLCETEEKNFALFFEDDRTSAEHNVCLYFGAAFKEFDGVIFLEIEIVIVCLRAEANFFHHDFLRFGLDLFLLFLLLVEEFLVIDYAANRRIGVRNDFNEIETCVFRNVKRFLDRVNAGFNAFAYQANLGNVADLLVDPVKFLLYTRATRTTLKRRT